jgi:hypothetical protein
MWRHDVKIFRRMWEVAGNKTRARWRLEAESKALDRNNDGTGMLSFEVGRFHKYWNQGCPIWYQKRREAMQSGLATRPCRVSFQRSLTTSFETLEFLSSSIICRSAVKMPQE